MSTTQIFSWQLEKAYRAIETHMRVTQQVDRFAQLDRRTARARPVSAVEDLEETLRNQRLRHGYRQAKAKK